MNLIVTRVFFSLLIVTTIYHEFVAADLKKRLLLKGLVGAGLLFKTLKPKKASLPIPLPMTLPVEWGQPQMIAPAQIPIHSPPPMPLHVPMNMPMKRGTPSCDLNPTSTFELNGELVSSSKLKKAKIFMHPCTKNILRLTNHIVMDPNTGEIGRNDLVDRQLIGRQPQRIYLRS